MNRIIWIIAVSILASCQSMTDKGVDLCSIDESEKHIAWENVNQSFSAKYGEASRISSNLNTVVFFQRESNICEVVFLIEPKCEPLVRSCGRAYLHGEIFALIDINSLEVVKFGEIGH